MKQDKSQPRFSCLLRNLARKRSAAILKRKHMEK